MRRRDFLLASVSSLLCAATARASAAAPLAFDELYAGVGVLGLKFSDKLLALAGRSVAVAGFMAPPLKAQASFFVLTREPVSLCPFCNSDADWPDDIILVKLGRDQEFVQNNRQIEVTGTLEVGSATDEETGFVSLVRLTNARFRVL